MHEIIIDTFYPVDPLIKQYVDYYYVLNPAKQVLSNAYTAYPSVNNPVIFFENTKVTAKGQHHHLQFCKDTSYHCGVIDRFIIPVDVTLTGTVKTINIIFKGIGLNAFINKPYAHIIKSIFQPFNNWHVSEDFIAELFTLPGQQLVERLDTLLLNNYKPFTNEPLLAAINLMSNHQRSYEINEIEQALNISRKTLLRLFKINTGISPTAFRRILRFRHALEENRTKDYSLTQLAYEANFTDQSHFIKELRKLTNDKPSAFIKNAAYVNGSKFLIRQHV
jgi:AraC-like DNA-binding protein